MSELPPIREHDPKLRPEPDAAVAAAEVPYGFQDDLPREVERAVAERRLDVVERLADELHSADLADLLERLDPEDRDEVVRALWPRLRADAEALTWLDEKVRGEILARITPEELAAALAELDSDDALLLVEELDEEQRAQVLAHLPAKARRLFEEGLSFPEYSAGRLMRREVVAVPKFWTVGKVIDWLRLSDDLPDEFFEIFVTDPMFRPVGGVPLSRVIRSRRSVRLADLVTEEDVRTIPAAMDQEEVAYLFRQYGLVSAPVVDEAGRLLGVITVDDVVDVITEEAEDDLLKLGGVVGTDLYRDVLDTSWRRFPWLGVNLITAFIASSVVGLFESTIAQVVALAVLMPIVAGMGGNTGTQSLTVAVRGIAMKRLTRGKTLRQAWKETLVGSTNGLVFAVLTGLVAGLWFHDPRIGLVIGAAMMINLTVAGLAGTLIPVALDRLGIDPAIASGVFLTTVTDVVGFLSFLGLAAVVLL